MNTQYIYRVVIKNIMNNRIFDNYLIKVMPSELSDIEKHIHERYPHNILSVKFEVKD